MNTQAAYRNGRFTTGGVWALKTAVEKNIPENEETILTSIHLSSAFDTIVREKLVSDQRQLATESEVRMIIFLLDKKYLIVTNQFKEGCLFERRLEHLKETNLVPFFS